MMNDESSTAKTIELSLGGTAGTIDSFEKVEVDVYILVYSVYHYVVQ